MCIRGRGVAVVSAICWIWALITSIATFQSFEIPILTLLLRQTLQSMLRKSIWYFSIS